MADELSFDGDVLVQSLRATFTRRDTPADVAVLDDMATELAGRKWARDWATMRKDKGVRAQLALTDAIGKFARFVGPLLVALDGDGSSPGRWEPGGPWSG